MTLDAYETGLNGFTTPVEIEVRNSVAISVKHKEKVNQEYLRQEYADYDTVEKLFDFVESKIKQEKKEHEDNSNANKGNIIGGLKVFYDDELGYPKKINFMPYRGAIDGSLSITITSFKNLSQEFPCR